MNRKSRLTKSLTLLVLLQLALNGSALATESLLRPAGETSVKPSGVLANAANAAAAAASAAKAAANAANAAAAAAGAALEAINSISGQNSVPAADAGGTKAIAAPVSQHLLPSTAETQTVAAAKEETSSKPTGSNRFFVPSERSLIGLTGRFEIPVFSEASSELTRSVAGYQAIGGDPLTDSGETNLAESVNAGRSFSRDSRVAGAKADQARAQTGQALALLLPSVSVRGSTGWETSAPSVALDPATGRPISSETHTRTDASLVVSQPLFDLPSYFDWRRRGIIEKARNESYKATDGDAYLTTVNAYMSMVSSRLQADMTRDFEAQLKELLTYIEKRTAAGAASVSDMARVKARSQSAVSARMELESAHTAACMEFVRVTNRMPKMVRLPELNDIGDATVPESLDYAVTMAMLNNPDIASLISEVQAAGIDRTAAKSRYLPRVNLEFSENYSQHAGGDPNVSGQRDRRVMFVMNWNLFNGGGDYKYHQEKIARKDELKYRLDDQRRRIAQTLASSYGTLSTTRERINLGYQELASISTAAEAMSKRMLSGNQSLLDLLDVYDRHYQARTRLVNLHVLEMNTMAQVVRLVKGSPGEAQANTTKPAAVAAEKPAVPAEIKKTGP